MSDNNPFLNNNYLGTNASINNVFIAKMPDTFDGENLVGKKASDIFSTSLFIEEIKKNLDKLHLSSDGIEEKMLPIYLEKCLESSDIDVKKVAESITKKFAERLAVILLTLKYGEKENRIKRSDWNDENWEYYKKIDTVILVGGLASSLLGRKIKYYIDEVFKKQNDKIYNIKVVENSSKIGIVGASNFIENRVDGYYIVFDLGQSFIKRSLVKIENDKITDIKDFDKVRSNHAKFKDYSEDSEKKEAEELDKFLQDVISSTIKQTIDNGITLNNTIPISIANYVQNGHLVNRGGYGKLGLVAYNYEEHISKEVSKLLGQEFNIMLIHDGTAMAGAFPGYDNSVCISLGTAFGIGFCTK